MQLLADDDLFMCYHAVVRNLNMIDTGGQIHDLNGFLMDVVFCLLKYTNSGLIEYPYLSDVDSLYHQP